MAAGKSLMSIVFSVYGFMKIIPHGENKYSNIFGKNLNDLIFDSVLQQIL